MLLGSLAAHAAVLHALFGKALVRIIGAKGKPIFRSRCEHPVRLRNPVRHEIVYQYARVRIGAIEDDRGDAGRKPGRVEPRDKTLSRRLFVPRGAIDLAGEKQAFGSFDHQGSVKFARVDVVVFDRVTGT